MPYRISRLARRAGRDSSGSSAIEFGLLAPVLALGFLSMVDVGFALWERISIDSVLRAGAQAAMTDPGADDLEAMLSTIASDQFTVSTSGGSLSSTTLLLEAERFCACPESMSTEVNCTTPSCTGGAAAYVYYRIEAAKNSRSTFLPTFPLRSQAVVQIQ